MYCDNNQEGSILKFNIHKQVHKMIHLFLEDVKHTETDEYHKYSHNGYALYYYPHSAKLSLATKGKIILSFFLREAPGAETLELLETVLEVIHKP